MAVAVTEPAILDAKATAEGHPAAGVREKALAVGVTPGVAKLGEVKVAAGSAAVKAGAALRAMAAVREKETTVAA